MPLGIHRTASAIRLRWIQRSTPFMPILAVFSIAYIPREILNALLVELLAVLNMKRRLRECGAETLMRNLHSLAPIYR